MVNIALSILAYISLDLLFFALLRDMVLPDLLWELWLLYRDGTLHVLLHLVYFGALKLGWMWGSQSLMLLLDGLLLLGEDSVIKASSDAEDGIKPQAPSVVLHPGVWSLLPPPHLPKSRNH